MSYSIDGSCVGKPEGSKPDSIEPYTMNTKQSATLPPEKDTTAAHYNMNHKRRGLALIFNHERFIAPPCSTRQGTNIDRSNMVVRLSKLGFIVKPFQDLTHRQILKEVAAAARKDYFDCDCFVMVVLTHGDAGQILYAQDRSYKFEDLWSPFCSEKCPSLSGKPKLFFIQALDGSPMHSHLLFTHPDFLIAYSTIPGYYSWRRISEGSWFINSLCWELDQLTDDRDLLTMLTFVCQRVAVDFESSCEGDVDMHLKKQIPCITSTLTKLLKFTGKNIKF
ncbi:hypothetical protein FQR65_LT07398 [Abscondita terminalis]|nr:hypothetical protein FQR65_LT07398 [Abscondita terminalis]